MDINRKFWNEQQKILRSALLNSNEHQKAIELFLNQHEMIHSAKMAKSELWSFEDELWQNMTEDIFRRIPKNSKNSIAWHMWHSTRVEDITMNMLVAGNPQIFQCDNWLEKMKITIHDTGNAMDEASIIKLSYSIDIEALREYRLQVGRITREIVKKIHPEQLKQKIDSSRLQQVLMEGAVVEEARWLIEYWSRRKIAGLLLMPPTRHNFVHLNKSMRIK